MNLTRYVIVDVEATGPAPDFGSMTEIGAVIFGDGPPFPRIFHGKLRPISYISDPEAMKVCGYTWEKIEQFPNPDYTMHEFADWLALNIHDSHGSVRPIFVSDNPAWDFQWINYYFFKFLGRNPFGHSGRRIGDIYAGVVGNLTQPWKYLRETQHTHNPVDDAMGNAEALWKILKMMEGKDAGSRG